MSLDEQGKSVVAPFIQNQHFPVGLSSRAINFPIVLGDSGYVKGFGQQVGLPSSYLISKDGRVVKEVNGVVNPSDMEAAIQAQL